MAGGRRWCEKEKDQLSAQGRCEQLDVRVRLPSKEVDALELEVTLLTPAAQVRVQDAEGRVRMAQSDKSIHPSVNQKWVLDSTCYVVRLSR